MVRCHRLSVPFFGAFQVVVTTIAITIAPGHSASGQASRPASMSWIDAESAARSIKQRPRRVIERGVPIAATCGYTKVPVEIPPADPGDGYFTGTAYTERIVIMEPCGFDPNGPDLPVILVNNGYGLSPDSFFDGMSDIPDEANARGWLVVAFRQLDDKSYGVAPSPQQNVDRALDWFLDHYPVDEDRIYSVGWSAGGGAVASYAARHLDPSRPMIAAMVTNAGSYDLINTYNHEIAEVQGVMANAVLLKGPPSGITLWQYHLSHTEELNPTVNGVIPERTKLRNLRHIPTYHVWSTDDIIWYLREQNRQFANFMLALGSDFKTRSFSGLSSSHSWDLIDAKIALDFLSPKRLVRDPASFDVLADRNLTYYWADVTLRQQKHLSPIVASADLATQTITLALENISALTLRPSAQHIDLSTHFTVDLSTVDAGPTEVIVEGVAYEPTYVLIDGSIDHAWIHNPNDATITLALPSLGGVVDVRFDDYSAILTGPTTATPPSTVPLQLQATTPNASAFLLISLSEGAFPLSNIDPSDDRNLLIGLAQPPVILPLTLDATGQASLPIFAGNPALIGSTLYAQFVTYPGGATILDEISNRVDVKFISGG